MPGMIAVCISLLFKGFPSLITLSALRVAWCRSQARKLRWEEQIELVKEEMRRVVAYFGWKSKWWEDRAEARQVEGDDVTRRGLLAYAARQAKLFGLLKSRSEDIRVAACAKAVAVSALGAADDESADDDNGESLSEEDRLAREVATLNIEDVLHETRWDTSS